MSSIPADIQGIIRELSLKPSDVLIPLYEMVINSIQSIEERQEKEGNKDRGKIRIEIIRDYTQGSLFPNQTTFPIKSIVIIDNGIGFTNENYKSFSVAYTSKKQKLGGKGIGRFAALSVFENIKLDSIIVNNGGRQRKKFQLNINEGLTEPEISTSSSDIRTIVTLEGIKDDFIKASTKFTLDSIAEHLLSHCLLFFINQTAPTIEIFEENTIINLDNKYNPCNYIKDSITLDLREHSFKFYFLPNTKKQHNVSYCANSRKVKSKKVVSILPIFSSPVTLSDGQEVFYDIYVVSSYLDSIVNSSRTDLKFPKEDSEDTSVELSGNLPTEKEIEGIISDAIIQVFDKEIVERRQKVKTNVKVFLCSDDGIAYRHLSLDDNFYDSIPDDINEKRLSDILHDEDYKHSKKRRAALDKINERDYSNTEEYRQLIKEYMDLSTDEGLSKLGQYITHRKVIIELLEKYLQWNEKNDCYEQEQVLHNLIYTMGGDSETINYDKHNLWLLDDRLSFHKYIYSDRQIKSHKPVEGISNSRKETDIAIYDIAFHYAEKNEYEEVKSVVIFELKRPNRDLSYFDFFKQMKEQIKGIESGNMKDSSGRNVFLPGNTPLTFYFVCDSNTFNQLKSDAKEEGFILTPYHSLMRVIGVKHIEIMTYQTILINSKRRNKIFFEKMGIIR